LSSGRARFIERKAREEQALELVICRAIKLAFIEREARENQALELVICRTIKLSFI